MLKYFIILPKYNWKYCSYEHHYDCIIQQTYTVDEETNIRLSYSVFCECVDLFDGDDLSHECAEPLWIQEVELTQLRLNIAVVKEYTTLVKKVDGLKQRMTATAKALQLYRKYQLTILLSCMCTMNKLREFYGQH